MSVPESVPVGSVVGRIWAKDRDIGVNAEMKYSIIDGDGRDTFDIITDPTNLFGVITVKKVKKKRQLIKGYKKVNTVSVIFKKYISISSFVNLPWSFSLSCSNLYF